MRLTKQRKAIIQIFEECPSKALSAEMIYNEVNCTSLNLSTVYRTLEKLLEVGLIGKVQIDNVAYYYLSEHSHKHFMICTQCQMMLPIDCIIKEAIPSLEEENHFRVMSHDVVLYGLCESCQSLSFA